MVKKRFKGWQLHKESDNFRFFNSTKMIDSLDELDDFIALLEAQLKEGYTYVTEVKYEGCLMFQKEIKK